MKNFHGKVAAITGASSGIGRALALELARRGCHLSLCDVQEAALEAIATEARALGVTVTAQRVDVSQRGQVEAWATQTVADHGKLNLVVNNAGVALVASIDGASYEALEWIIGINFWGVVHGTKAFLPHLKTSGEGHIVNLSSVFGIAGIPGQGAYNATKFAVRGFTECLRQELELMDCGVSATCVHPGGIKTNIGRAARKDGDLASIGLDADESGENFEKIAMTTPHKAALSILRAVERNKRRVLVGPDAYLFDWTVRLLPTAYQRIIVFMSQRLMKKRQAAA